MLDLRPERFFRLEGFEHRELFEGVRFVWEALGRLQGYLEAWPRFEVRGEVMAGAFLADGRVHLGEGSVVEPGAMIKGPAIIGRNCQIRQGAYLRGNVIVGDGCVVGHATEVKDAVLLPGSKAPHFAYVGNSILGRDVNLGAGTRLSNLKITEDEVRIPLEGRWVPTGMRKLGAILGDGVKTGCNCVLNPGALLGPGCLVYPNLTVQSGWYPPGSILKLRQQLVRGQRR